MPLDDGYGVLIGTLSHSAIEDPDSEGRWPHYQIYVNAPNGLHECVINLKSRNENKVQYRAFMNVERENFVNIWNLSDGFHLLESSPSSGALDVVRHPGLQNPICHPKDHLRFRFPFDFLWRFYPLRKKNTQCECIVWWLEKGMNLVELMEYFLEGVDRLYVFGERYRLPDLGVHNIHMNQGDPVGSQWSDENGIWQDGGIIFQYNNPEQRWAILLTKFQSQVFTTGEDGLPIP